MASLIFEVIEWFDHANFVDNSWVEANQVEELKPLNIVSSGWIIKEDKLFVVLASTVDVNFPVYKHLMCILKSAIASRTRIKTCDIK